MIYLDGQGALCECCASVIANGDESGCRDFHGHTHPSGAVTLGWVHVGDERAREYGEDECAGCGQELGDTVHGFGALVSPTAVDEFVRAYETAMLWANATELGGDGSDEGEYGPSLDAVDNPEELTEDAHKRMRADCLEFLAACLGTVRMGETRLQWLYPDSRGGYSDDDLAGHDFALTRNHHGAGFWDRGLPGDLGDKLTKIAQSFGDASLTREDGVITHD